MNNEEGGPKAVRFPTENTEFLSEVLAHGNSETRGYALAAFAQGGSVEEIEAVRPRLDGIKQELKA